MLTVITTVCAVMLVAVFVRLGNIRRTLRENHAEDVGADQFRLLPKRWDPMKQTRGPRDLAEMQSYFYGANRSRSWAAADPEVTRLHASVAARRVAKA